jgi:DNA-binding transcriptional MocR family regulator
MANRAKVACMAPPTISAARLVPLLGSATAATPAYRGLADAIRLLVADGRVATGTRLPSERDLTAALGVSRTTVARAYAVLRERGYLTSRQGSGSVTALPGGGTGHRRGSSLSPADLSQVGDTIDLTCASMSAPSGTMAAYEAAVGALPTHLAGTGYQPLGLESLREALAAWYTARRLPTTPDQVLVTSGALSALAITARALLAPGDRVLVENPTYANAIDTLHRSGARAVPLPVESSGWDLPGAEATLRQTAPRAAYLIPDFQNPTGALMSDADRGRLARALGATRTVAVVDETLAELCLDDGVALPRPMAAHHRRTVTVGGASKSFWGGLRIGWIRAPHDLVANLLSARLSLDLGAPVLEQLVLLELLSHRDEILAERRAAVAASRDVLVGALRERLPQWEFRVPNGGLCLWVQLPEALSSAVTAAADRHGLVLAPGPQFAVEGGMERFLRIPFTSHAPDLLVEAVDRLALAWQDAVSARPAGRPRSPLVA